jgi:hypothetical protein
MAGMDWILRRQDEMGMDVFATNVPGVACFLCSRFTQKPGDDGKLVNIRRAGIDELQTIAGWCEKTVDRVAVKGFDNCMDFALQPAPYWESELDQRPVVRHLQSVSRIMAGEEKDQLIRQLRHELRAAKEKSKALRATIRAMKDAANREG